MNFTLPKSERLHSEKLIKELFNEGSSFFLYPFKVIFKRDKTRDGGNAIVLFSAPKRKLKKAHQRNLVKRRMREAYRLNKHILTGVDPIFLGFIYVSDEIIEFKKIELSISEILNRLKTEISRIDEEDTFE